MRDNADMGITFENRLTDEKHHNIFSFRNYYNGGGVSIGDINNDGLNDIFFTSNQNDNKLYLNKGNWKFEDVTKQSKVGGEKFWSTGSTMVDINGDGWLDIYVCNSGNVKGDLAANELFVNNQDGTFDEMAKEYGLHDKGLSTHAIFFDYDIDGDLDCYILNNSFRPIESFNFASDLRSVVDSLGGDRFYENIDGKYKEKTSIANIYSSDIGFGLGISSADINMDGYPDLYVSNDFFERDYLYINQKNKTFKEDIENQIGHISLASMGSDIADINNDGYVDIFTTEMLPEHDKRMKEVTSFETYDVKSIKNESHFYNQYMQNCLQVNNGNQSFSEVAFYSGIASTDWSWGALFFDMDNDGYKDLYVSNGIYKDLTNQDFIDFLGNEENIKKILNRRKFDYKEFVSKMSSTPIRHYAFSCGQDFKFVDKTNDWGLDQKSFSNGSAYGDLDNDGDLDLVVNNLNKQAFIYENNINKKKENHYLKIKLNGSGLNKSGIGTIIKVYCKGDIQLFYNQPSRGFQSSIPPNEIIVGLKKKKIIDSIQVIWQNHFYQTLTKINTDQTITINQKEAKSKYDFNKGINSETIFKDVTKEIFTDIPKHQENIEYIDFDNNHLQPQSFSQQSPSLLKADFNNDGMEDVFFSSAKNDFSKLFIQSHTGKFLVKNFTNEKEKADVVDAKTIDINKDGALDLILLYSGNQLNSKQNLLPKIWLNDGKANFSLYSEIKIDNPLLIFSSLVVCDYDHDNDEDILITSKGLIGEYGVNGNAYLFNNDGSGKFSKVKFEPNKTDFGIITKALWEDINNDGWEDLLIVGNWMKVMLYINKKGILERNHDLDKYTGWWNELVLNDIDGDGDKDILLGNLGVNSKLFATPKEPMDLYVKDIDGNGKEESLICMYKPDHKQYCFQMRREIITQMPSFKKKFLTHASYAGKEFSKIFPSSLLKGSTHRQIRYLKSGVLKNNNGKFVFIPFPYQAQLAPINSIIIEDVDNDNQEEYILSGNNIYFRPEVGRLDANRGLVMKISKEGEMSFLPPVKTGLNIDGEVRSSISIKNKKNENFLLFGLNNKPLQVYQY